MTTQSTTERRVGGSTGWRTCLVVLQTTPWRARTRQSLATSARVPKHNEEECELGPTNPSLAHRSQGNDAQAAGQKSEGALEECAGAAAAENEKRTVLWYVKADYD